MEGVPRCLFPADREGTSPTSTYTYQRYGYKATAFRSLLLSVRKVWKIFRTVVTSATCPVFINIAHLPWRQAQTEQSGGISRIGVEKECSRFRLNRLSIGWPATYDYHGIRFQSGKKAFINQRVSAVFFRRCPTVEPQEKKKWITQSPSIRPPTARPPFCPLSKNRRDYATSASFSGHLNNSFTKMEAMATGATNFNRKI